MNLFPPIVAEMIKAARTLCQDLREQISEVRHAGIDPNTGKELILFKLRERTFLGVLQGRNVNCLLGVSPEADKAIALRVLLDGAATETQLTDIKH